MVPLVPGGRRLTIAVTGARGYIGSRLCRHLHDVGTHRIRTVGRSAAPAWLATETHVAGDLVNDPSTAKEACAGADTVIHLAGPNETAAAGDGDAAVAETATAARNIGRAVADGQARLIYVSTVHVYGSGVAPGTVLTERSATEPTAAYARARIAAELALAAEVPPERLVVLRLSNSVGAPVHPAVDRWSLLANDLCREGAVRNTLTLRSDGLQWRDFVPLADVCRIIAAVLEPQAELCGTFNLASGNPMTVRSLAGVVQDVFSELTGAPPVLRAPEPTTEPTDPYRVDVARLAAYGLRADGDIRRAVEEIASFCLTHREYLRDDFD